jgi:hypothetical protein
VEVKPDCALVLFELQGRQVAGWVVRNGAVCPEPRHPGKDALAKLVAVWNEVLGKPVPGGPLRILPLSANLTHAWRGTDAGRLHVA